MFRFIHAADPHIDSPLEGLEAYEGAPVDALRGATRRAFESLVALAIEEEVQFLLIAGDLYDRDWKDFSTGLFVVGQMAQLREAGIPVYLIAGNHDAASVITKKLRLPENVHVFSTRTVETREVDGLPVAIHGRGFPNRAVPENLVPEYPDPAPGRFNIGLLHTSLQGRPGHDSYAPCSESDLRGKGYDYWALGHIHQPEVVGREPWIVFAGNCQGRHARELGPRGCYLVTVGDSREVAEAEFRHLDVIRWAQVGVDLTGAANEHDALDRIGGALESEVARADGRLMVARLVLRGATVLHDSLRRDPERWRAEVIGLSAPLGPEGVWIERVIADTGPVYDLESLKARDDLTRIVLESLEGDGGTELPSRDDIDEMLKVLPPEVRQEVEADLTPESRTALLGDVRSIILDVLRAKGGEAA